SMNLDLNDSSQNVDGLKSAQIVSAPVFRDSNDLGASKGYRHGNPFSLLKLQMLRIDPLSSEAGREQALEHAKDLGLDACRDCKGCKCGVGIDLMGKVVRPLLAAAAG
ncbi:MAG: hypothetical protein VXV97_14880, partial [Pseudomonadota bacterium]|nr:hypothetical protein [Pseudomonadota bacterium]